MKLYFVGAMSAVATLASAQVLFSENFDGLSVGDLGGQNSWLDFTDGIDVVAEGGGNPSALSGTQMAGAFPTSAAQAIRVVNQGSFDPGNDILRVTGFVYVSSTSGILNAYLSVTGILGSTPTRYGAVGVTGAGEFSYGDSAAIFTTGTANLDDWNSLQMDVDLAANTTSFYGNGSFLGMVNNDPSLVLNNVSIEGVGGQPSNAFFDDVQAEAVPEPATMAILGGLGLLAARRRKAQA